MLPGGEVVTKEMDLRFYRDQLMKVDELHPNIENLNIIGDLAVITLAIALKGIFNNVPFEANFRYIRFWKKLPDGIKVAGGSAANI